MTGAVEEGKTCLTGPHQLPITKTCPGHVPLLACDDVHLDPLYHDQRLLHGFIVPHELCLVRHVLVLYQAFGGPAASVWSSKPPRPMNTHR